MENMTSRMNKPNNVWIIMGFLLIFCLLILDLVNIGNYVPALAQINYQLWNIIAVVGVFLFGFHYIDKRDLKRKQAQEDTGRFLIQLSYKNCRQMIDYLNVPEIKKTLLSDFDGNAPIMSQRRYVGVHDLPFADDQDIKKLAFDGTIEASDFEQYIEVKTFYQNMVAMYFIAPDHPEIFNEQKLKLLKILPVDNNKDNEKEKRR